MVRQSASAPRKQATKAGHASCPAAAPGHAVPIRTRSLVSAAGASVGVDTARALGLEVGQRFCALGSDSAQLDSVRAFTLESITALVSWDAQLLHLTHDSGACYYHLLCERDYQAFLVAVRTPPEDR